MTNHALLFFRSLLFSCFSIISILLYSFFCLVSWVLPVQQRIVPMLLFLKLHLFVLKKICHIDYEIKGLEHIPKDRCGVVMCKHQSTWETFLLPQLFPRFTIIVKRELFWVPFFGWGLASLNPIAINRKDKLTAMQQIILQGKKNLSEGRWVIVFPEGTRVAVGKIGHYRLGGAKLAVEANSFIIPVAHNAGYFWPRRKFIKKPGKIQVIIGPPILAQGRNPDEVLAQTKAWIEETVRQI